MQRRPKIQVMEGDQITNLTPEEQAKIKGLELLLSSPNATTSMMRENVRLKKSLDSCWDFDCCCPFLSTFLGTGLLIAAVTNYFDSDMQDHSE